MTNEEQSLSSKAILAYGRRMYMDDDVRLAIQKLKEALKNECGNCNDYPTAIDQIDRIFGSKLC